MKRLVISEAARSDLTSIGEYTERVWGRTQKSRYVAALKEGIRKIQRSPAIGRSRADIRPGYLSFTCGRHVVFYRETNDTIEIIRLLHQKMDVHSRFEGDEH